MNPEPLDLLFRSLPRETASEYFTPRVMARIRAERAPARWRRIAALAAPAILVTAVGLAIVGGWQHAARMEASRLAAARAEQLRLEQELQQIKELTAGLQPVVYVGSTREYDVYVELDALQEDSSSAKNASYRVPSRPGV